MDLELKNFQKGRYIVAVSGGVDSMSLLHCLVSQGYKELVVAHFNHGIREDSKKDKLLVEKTAKKYGLVFETISARLGVDASEQKARHKRYEFLRNVQKKHTAQGLITAHHADDIVETMVINIIRGTGWRGLCSLRSFPETVRPLLSISKKDIIMYAKKNAISWREDSSNQDTKYLRNEIRQKVIPRLDTTQWLKMYQKQAEILAKIENELCKRHTHRRYQFIMWPQSVALEMLRSQFSLTRPQATRLLTAIKTARPGTRSIIDTKELTFTPDEFVVK